MAGDEPADVPSEVLEEPVSRADLERELRDLRVENRRLEELLLQRGPQDLSVAGKVAPSVYLTENVERLGDRIHELPGLVWSRGWDYVLVYARPDLVAAFRALNLNPRRMTPDAHQAYDRLRRWLTDPPLFRLLAMPGRDYDVNRSEWLAAVEDVAVGVSMPEIWLHSVEVPLLVTGRER